MREILFKGKRTDNGEWIEGDLLTDGIDYITAIRVHNSNELGESALVTVISETVGQYTGLNDKNGNKIFEGDIVRLCRYAFEWEDKSNWKFEIGYIRFKNGCFIIEDIYSSDGYNELSCVYDAITCGGEYDSCVIFEVIGNKWDNLELLKGGEQE